MDYIYKNQDSLLSMRRRIMLRRHNDSLSALFGSDYRFVDRDLAVLNLFATFKLQHIVRFVQASRRDVAQDMGACHVFQNSSLFTCFW